MPSKKTILYAVVSLLVAAFFVFALTAKAEAATSDPPFEVKFPQDTSVTEFDSTFGARRSGGRRHKGNDLMAPKMTAVYAIADGYVETVSDGRSSGRYLTIVHAEGWSSSYMHLNNDDPGTDNGRASWEHTLAPGVFEGAFVQSGQLIGYVGDSGNAEWTGSHTHFELLYQGRAVNPYEILSDAWERDHTEYLRTLWVVGDRYFSV